MTPGYPLSAVAHQPQLMLALSLLAVSPEVGGLLIRGDRGAAKSTAARGLSVLLPGGGPFVNLPLGATEDRVVGTLDLEAALQGEVKLKPGLLAQSDGGLLYIDEVNLLPDHLVDVLLDAAAMGVVRVQRDSLSAQASARFALVGSMNPEEGELRPQFLDRFGLCVDVLAPLDAEARAEIIRRRLSYESDPQGFVEQWQPEEGKLRERLRLARAALLTAQLPDDFLPRIAGLTGAAGVRSLRADLVLCRAARAHAALSGRTQVEWTDIETVAPLVLNHRRDPRQCPPAPQAQTPPEHSGGEGQSESGPVQATQEEIFAPSAAASTLPLPRPPARRGSGGEREGRVVRTVSQPSAARLHVPDTLRAGVMRSGAEFSLSREDFRTPVHELRGGRRLFVVDSSGSLGLGGRISAVKGMMLAALAEQSSRDQVALIVFRGGGAELLLDWTNDAQAVASAVRTVPTGGRTPLAHALDLAFQVLARQQNAELVLFTDGRANVPLTPGSDAWTDALSAATQLRGFPALVVDTEVGHVRLGRAAKLAQVLEGQVTTLESV